LAGQTINNVEETLDADSRFETETPNAVIAVRGTAWVVFARNEDLTQVATTEGEVEVRVGDDIQTVAAGYGLPIKTDEALGDVKVWGLPDAEVNVPEGVAVPPLRVTFTNRDSGQVFFYRIGDEMPVVLGTYDVRFNAPGPVQVPDVVFPADTAHGQIQPIEVDMGAVVLEVLDADGQPFTDQVVVTLTQGELSNTTVVTSGETLLAGPGDWQVTYAPEAQPDQAQTVGPVTATAGLAVPATITLAGS
ncbi:MAG: FecR domain-containing protein, partial [Chloroflexi bacterium]|nr:FecR domain-containing protein [Chloroflexota bacterium]